MISFENWAEEILSTNAITYCPKCLNNSWYINYNPGCGPYYKRRMCSKCDLLLIFNSYDYFNNQNNIICVSFQINNIRIDNICQIPNLYKKPIMFSCYICPPYAIKALNIDDYTMPFDATEEKIKTILAFQ